MEQKVTKLEVNKNLRLAKPNAYGPPNGNLSCYCIGVPQLAQLFIQADNFSWLKAISCNKKIRTKKLTM